MLKFLFVHSGFQVVSQSESGSTGPVDLYRIISTDSELNRTYEEIFYLKWITLISICCCFLSLEHNTLNGR